MFFIDLGDTQVVGSSPEVLVRVQNRVVTLRPIAGTRPRGANPAEDKRLQEDLLSDPKELAEDCVVHIVEDYNYATKLNYVISDAFCR